jgi:hypothetical protein
MGTASIKTDYADSYGGSSASAWTFSRPADTTAYAVGDVIGETGGVNATFKVSEGNRGVIITGAQLIVNATSFSVGAARLHLFNQAPTAIADNAAFDVIAGDRDKYLGFIEFAAPTDLGSTGFVSTDGLNIVRPLATGGTIWAQLETRTASTPSSAISKTIKLLTMDV